MSYDILFTYNLGWLILSNQYKWFLEEYTFKELKKNESLTHKVEWVNSRIRDWGWETDGKDDWLLK